MKKIVLTSLMLSFQLVVYAQNSPTFRQFYFNPFLFNPAFIEYGGQTDVFVFHRQQWINFNDAPSASGLNVQHPFNTRTSIAFNFITQKAVALRNTSALATFGYHAPLSARQSLYFGISGGFGSNALDLEGIDYTNDPAILNAAANSFYADGNFGVVYTRDALKLGFSLPRLFGQKYFSPYRLDNNPASQFLNQLYSLSYKFNFKSKAISIEPYFLYRLNRDFQNFWELTVLSYSKEKLWFGVSYQHTQGVAFLTGMEVSDKFRFGYSFELPPVNSNFQSTTSHELHVRVRLHKRKPSNEG